MWLRQRFDCVCLCIFGMLNLSPISSAERTPGGGEIMVNPQAFLAKSSELARASGANYEWKDGTYDHNFRTLIIDATGRLQMIFPTGGNLSDQIVAEIVKAAAVTNQAGSQN